MVVGIWHVKRHGKVSGDKHRCNISSVLTGASVAKAAASYSGTGNLRWYGYVNRFTSGNLVFYSYFKAQETCY